jgi:hypothetical protein
VIRRASPDCCCQQLPHTGSHDAPQTLDLTQAPVELVPTRENSAHHFSRQHSQQLAASERSNPDAISNRTCAVDAM